MRSRARFSDRRSSRGSWGTLALAVLGLSACGARPPAKDDKLGKIPEVVTHAEPEWLPFAIRAGERAEGDRRESHLAELRVLTKDGDVASATWSPDARRLAIEARMPGDAQSQVYVMDLGTGALSRASQPSVQSTSPTFAWPDGARVLFTESSASGRRVVSTKSDGSDPKEVVGADGADPALFVDGSSLLFVRAEGGSRDLFVKPLGGDGPAHRLLADPQHDEARPVTSPDRTRIAWIGAKKPTSQLFTARVGSPPQEALRVEALSTELESIASADFLPDSHRIAFASDRDEPSFDVYVVDLDERFGPGAPPRSLRVTYAAGGSQAPAFAPDGRHVAFVSRRYDHRASAPRRLFVARWIEDP